MNIFAPPSEHKDRPVKTDPKFLATSLNSTLRELVELEDGRTVTKAQAISERLVDIAIFSSSNADSVSAAKLVFDRVLGKAAVQKTEEIQEMPKVILALRDDDLNSMAKKAEKALPEQEDDPAILVETNDGEYLL